MKKVLPNSGRKTVVEHVQREKSDLMQSRLTQPSPLHCPPAPPADPHDPALLALVSGGRHLLRHTVLLADWTLRPRPSLRSSTPCLLTSSAELCHCPHGPAGLSTSTSPPCSSAPTLPPSLSAPPSRHTRTAAPVLTGKT
ncbi:hypothetical protein E2562_009298 [Oryza meyeriana var. granulata]|uniref:Uncharacterized protein n=1 Tax=Oryza meyeriana var. granulata TaxID=110450 RepID=A0A6G1E9Z4_9ORYZ|nr:hypothetical protein E2562_009298 [Oryza meyeriana var. granulata]